MSRIAVLGGGNWGTTLALHLLQNRHEVGLWEFFPELAGAMKRDGENKRYLPGVPLPESLKVSADLGEIARDAEVLLFVVPSHLLRELLWGLKEVGLRAGLAVSAIKGLETDSHKRMSEVVGEELPQFAKKVVALSGPSLALEVARGVPTAVVAACDDEEKAGLAQKAFFGPGFRVYTSTDIAGVELGGALKNIIAIAAGISDGLGFGDNARGALLTRGLAEMTRLGTALGARPETFSGLSGMGDLITTCSSKLSRNHQVGIAIAQGKKLEAVLKELVMVAEGVKTTTAANQLARLHGVEMPIADQMQAILFEGKDPREGVMALMQREPKAEAR